MKEIISQHCFATQAVFMFVFKDFDVGYLTYVKEFYITYILLLQQMMKNKMYRD